MVSLTIKFKGYSMQLTTHGDTHFKGVTKNLTKELKRQGFDISHANALNITAIALGYKNYNTYKALTEKKHNKKPSTIKQAIEDAKQKLKQAYPSIKSRFVSFPRIKNEQLNAYIYREMDDETYRYYMVFERKNNITGRVFYAPRYDSILLFVYPDIKTGVNDYNLPLHEIDSSELHKSYFKDILHLLQTKDWASPDLLSDTMELMEALVLSRDRLNEINKLIIENEDLERLFNEGLDED